MFKIQSNFYDYFYSVFSASIECSPKYKTTDKIECKFHLKNNDQRKFSVLKWRTPLDGMTSDCLTATCNGEKLQYDGVYMKRSTPGPHHFLPVGAGETLSSTFDASDAYDMTKAGTYSIQLDSYVEYAVGSAKGMKEAVKVDTQTKTVHLSSPTVTFQIVGGTFSRGTLGQQARFFERRDQFARNRFPKESFRDGAFNKRGQSMNAPRDPIIKPKYKNKKRVPKAQKEATRVAHRAAFQHMRSSIEELQNNEERAKTWFGLSHVRKAIDVFETMQKKVGKDKITYVFGGKYCDAGTFAYTFKGSRKIFLCKSYEQAETVSGFDNKMGILTHELSHAITGTDDIAYGQPGCKQLARKAPHKAVKNADNYEYFVESSSK